MATRREIEESATLTCVGAAVQMRDNKPAWIRKLVERRLAREGSSRVVRWIAASAVYSRSGAFGAEQESTAAALPAKASNVIRSTLGQRPSVC